MFSRVNDGFVARLDSLPLFGPRTGMWCVCIYVYLLCGYNMLYMYIYTYIYLHAYMMGLRRSNGLLPFVRRNGTWYVSIYIVFGSILYVHVYVYVCLRQNEGFVAPKRTLSFHATQRNAVCVYICIYIVYGYIIYVQV